ncbi:alpha-1,3-mannosyl-glycoprotein 4-beta-N-acetylglucosaminyltransferase A-like [Artemia franciscana]|uniref:Alpha-1,3-mannosyl-glycoprotein 4-beta-N-acetylglucosaminyltransferase A n=1 Tax=Artemia franciscana TaxID=6661 RepID=A0AA88L9Q7_ARTSF|nr:hypothetical protein QYM36_002764 [Artemia franciscana]
MSRKKFLVIIILGIFPALMFLLSSFSDFKEDNERHLELLRNIGELKGRLEHLEMRVSYRKAEQFIEVLSIHNLTNNSSGESFLKMPSAFHYLPHLTNNINSTRVKLHSPVKPGGRPPATLVFGIPTVKREGQSYLIATLANLFSSAPAKDLLDCLFIVLIAETDEQLVESIDVHMKERFSKEMEQGILQVISPSEGYYPDWSTLKITLDDPIERVRWRTKQNLDYAFLMMYAQTQGTYYIQLEDDVLSLQDYVRRIKDYAFEMEKAKRSWFVAEFCQLGFIGKMFHSSDLTYMIQFFTMFHNDRPADWLIDPLFETRFCPVDQKKCRAVKKNLWLRYKPSLFQHVGTVSSLKGKVQKLKDKAFGKLPLFVPHTNPAARVTTVIKAYKKHTIESVYLGVNFFWGLSPQEGDIISFKFTKPVKLKSYLVRSGNPEHPSDLLYNATVEVSASFKNSINLSSVSDGFLVIGRFDELGVAKGDVPEEIEEVYEFRLSIHSESKNWVIISEVSLEPR